MPNFHSEELKKLFAENPQLALEEADRVLTNNEVYIDLLRDAVVEGNIEVDMLKHGPHVWKWNARIERKWQDLWIGAFWRRDKHGRFDLWLTLVPCFPLHIRNYRDKWNTRRDHEDPQVQEVPDEQTQVPDVRPEERHDGNTDARARDRSPRPAREVRQGRQ